MFYRLWETVIERHERVWWEPAWRMLLPKMPYNEFSGKCSLILAWASEFLPFLAFCPLHGAMLALSSSAICSSSSGLPCGKAGQLGQPLWSGRYPLGAKISQAHFYVCPKPRFQLGEKLWNLSPKASPKLCFSFLQLPVLRDDCFMLLIMRALSVFEHLCAVQILGGHRAWLWRPLLFLIGEIQGALPCSRMWAENQKRWPFLLTLNLSPDKSIFRL